MTTTSVEVKQAKIAKLNDERTRWLRRLFRASREVEYREKQIGRLVKPKIPTPEEARRERKRENDRQRRLRKKEKPAETTITL